MADIAGNDRQSGGPEFTAGNQRLIGVTFHVRDELST
jgi:hypothetical protein